MIDKASSYDIAVVGAGPAGLSFAASLRHTPLWIALIDKLSEAALADPPYDGREIALTRQSATLLRELGVWDRIASTELAPLRTARVLNGYSRDALVLGARPGSTSELGYLVSNHLIRRAAYENAKELAGVTIVGSSEVRFVSADARAARLELADGRSLHATLIVAADTRFSATRRAMGIAARFRDFGKTMLVCRMRHEAPHEQTASEWFGHHQTLAVLPLNGDCSSIVLTLPHCELARMQQLPAETFAREMEQRFLGRLGRMELASERFAYPLVAVYPDRFVSVRCALIGDAAVGMHPVTAHGFNFGLKSQETLAGLIAGACSRGEDIGAGKALGEYDRAHRRATRALYLATNAIVQLFTDESPPGRILRGALLGLASRLPPVAAGISALLMQEGASPRRLVRPARASGM